MIFLFFFHLFFVAASSRSLLRSAPQMCPIDEENLIEVKLFVQDGNQCYNFCENTNYCEYFRYRYT